MGFRNAFALDRKTQVKIDHSDFEPADRRKSHRDFNILEVINPDLTYPSVMNKSDTDDRTKAEGRVFNLRLAFGAGGLGAARMSRPMMHVWV